MRSGGLAKFSALSCLSIVYSSGAVLKVGPNDEYTVPCQAIAKAQPGDRIEINAAGTYRGDVCAWKTSDLTLVGVNGRPKLEADGRAVQGRAIWAIFGNNSTIENLEFTGAAGPNHNGAGIWQQGTNLTVRRCYFHHNEEGILAGADLSSRIVIEYTEFADNGYSDGQSHNVYIGHIAEFTMRYSYSHDANYGHLLKSRAEKNFILYNRLTGELGTSSYELDLPNGGLAYVIGNVIEQGPTSENHVIVAYGEEGPTNTANELYFINNTVVNHQSNGVFIKADARTAQALVQNNVFSGPGEIMDPLIGKLSHNLVRGSVFVDPINYDYHLAADSPAVDFGAEPGLANGFGLRPVFQYVHPMCFETRKMAGRAIDAGAFEFRGGGGASPSCRVPANPQLKK